MVTLTHSPPKPRLLPLGSFGAVARLPLALRFVRLSFLYGVNAWRVYRTEISAQFRRRNPAHGDWITPRLYGEPLLTKPPLAYAAIALAGWPFGGVTDWSARLPSAAAATVVVFPRVFPRVSPHRRPTWRFDRGDRNAGSMLSARPGACRQIDMLQVVWVAAGCYVSCGLWNNMRRAICARGPANGMGMVAGGLALCRRRRADEMDGAGLLLPYCDPFSLSAERLVCSGVGRIC